MVLNKGFPGSSAGKESVCNAGDPSSIPGLGRSTGEGIGYPLQYSWAFLVAQLVKNPPAMCETWVQPLGELLNLTEVLVSSCVIRDSIHLIGFACLLSHFSRVGLV